MYDNWDSEHEVELRRGRALLRWAVVMVAAFVVIILFSLAGLRVANADGAPSMVIDVPQPRSSQSGIGLIHGWVCGGGQVDVAIDGQHFATVTADAPRWDVARAFPECGPSSGFGLPINWSNLEPGAHSLTANGVTVPFHVVGFGEYLNAGQIDFSRAIIAPGFDDTFWLYGVVVGGQETDLLYRWEPSVQGLSVLSVEPVQNVPDSCGFSPPDPACQQ